MMLFRAFSLLLLFTTALLTRTAFADCAEKQPSPHCGITPFALFDDNDRLWVTFADGGHVYLTWSIDNGASFQPSVKVNTKPEEIDANGENRPVLALGQNNEVFVAWTWRTNGPYSGDIRFARSTDGGRTFEAPLTVNDDNLPTGHHFAAMLTTPSGLLYLAWLDKRDQVAATSAGETYVGAALYYTVSADAGKHFDSNRKVADNSCECCRLALAPSGNDEIQVLWRHTFEDNQVRDHATATLGRTGASTVQRVSRDDWRINACPHHGPAIAATENGYHMAWFSNGNRNQGVMYGFFDSDEQITGHIASIDQHPSGGHPSVGLQGETITLVWKSFDGNRMNLRIVQSADGGRQWREAFTLASTRDGSDHPQLLQSDGELFVAWQTSSEGYRFYPVPNIQTETGTQP